MATFNQWHRSRALKRISWVCGQEYALAAEVEGAYQSAVPAVSTVILYADERSERDIWDTVLTAPPQGGRLVIVHGAEKLKALGNFEVLVGAEGMDTAFTVFFSSEPDFARVENGGKKTLAPHLAAIQASRNGQLIRCVQPSKEEDLLKLVSSWWQGAGANHAHELLKRCGGDLALAREACQKAELAGLGPTVQNVEYVASEAPARDYVNALLSGDAPAAEDAADLLSHSDVGYALAVLATRLGQLAALREAKDRGWDGQEIATKLRLDRYVQHQLTPLAGGYGPERVRACRELLATAESYWREGANYVAESVAALW